ncbi:MAG: hypothetical protein LBH28_05025 [Oscillospiraceae bacterium]|nr:hypothetical protein [Oscillospiraceae bacterium]
MTEKKFRKEDNTIKTYVKPEIEVMDLRLEKKGNETGNSEKCGDKTNCNTRNGTDNSATAIGYQSEAI